MDIQDVAQLLGNFGEFVGAIAVVGTLVYLAIQVKHSKVALEANTRALDESKKLTRTDFMYQASRRWDEVIRNATGTREAAAIFVRGNRNPSELDEVEQVIYQQQITPFLSWHMSAIEMDKDGFLGLGDELTYAGDEVIGDMLRRFPGMRTCWDAMKWTYPHREHVDDLLKQPSDLRRFVFGETLVPPARSTP